MRTSLPTLIVILVALVGCSSAPQERTVLANPTPTFVPFARPVEILPTTAQALEPSVEFFTSPAESGAASLEPSVEIFTSPAESGAASVVPAYSYPVGIAGRPLGDGFFIRHGYTVEHRVYNPGYWHTGEDWYVSAGDTADAQVYAVADGEVVYAGSNYPGRVVIVQHDDIVSVYGHLDPKLNVKSGQRVVRGTQLGTVLRGRPDGIPDHLHFEIRTFVTRREVNGAAPRYPFRCGINCPPGPGYWPFAAPELPSALGWRNPTHVIARRAFSPVNGTDLGEVVVASQPVLADTTLWAAVAEDGTPQQALDEQLTLQAGARFPLLEVRAGPEAPDEPTARAYQLWYRIRLPDGRTPWVQAAVPSVVEQGQDEHPATVWFNFYPAVPTP